MKYLYHVTNKENLNSILHWGLTPRIGSHSKEMEEQEKRLYLCDRKSVAAWMVLLKADVVLKIKIQDPDKFHLIEKFEYNSGIDNSKKYVEYITDSTIRKENISVIYNRNLADEESRWMKYLCFDYLDYLSNFCYYAAMYNSGNDDNKSYYLLRMKQMYKVINPVIDNLKFSSCGSYALRNYLINKSNKLCYCLADHYYDTDMRLYEKLIRYDYDEMKEERRRVSDYIYDNLHMYIKDLNVGGLTY